ncbi:ABC transporter, substrate-binding protein, family 5 [Jonquetella sp. BV3C21]|uniref:ABC-type oligopeptide transport system, periplasmic component n=2 Tax=Dethiosulfovibrionaceae TaxID=3029088 RepID=H0UMD6_9BACT|nr:ABC-type oligopeptide transport system, periplasmic component [Jonquetella anthropi DSM 22815]ERL24580.1 ABC transporter, substrate-binding protein, family 5 [Jonquetella sp. BV3C21]
MSMTRGLASTLGILVLAAGAAFAAPAPAGVKMDENMYLNLNLGADPTTLDVSRRSDAYSSNIEMDCMEGLVRLIDENGQYKMQPMEASSWDVSEDGKVYTFHLRDGLKWCDGEPVTAEQYVYGIRRSADPKVGCPNSFFLEPLANYGPVSRGEMPVEKLGVSAPDSKTVVFTLSEPTPIFLNMINQTVYYPQREDKVKEWGDKFGTEAKYWISNGAFKVTEWVHNNKLVTVKNENYFDAKNVHLQRVTWLISGDAAATYNQFLAGQIDGFNASKKEQVQELENRNDLQYNKIVSNTVAFAMFNTRDKIFKNAKIRRAFSLTFDREMMNDMVYGGLRAPANGWVLDASAIGTENFRAHSGKLFDEQYAELEKEGKTPRDLLLEGMKEEGLGDDPAALKVVFSLGGTDAFMRNMGDFFQQVCAETLGVRLEIDFKEWGVFSSNLEKHNYQIGFMAWGAYYSDPYDLLSILVSDSDMIRTGWKNEKFDSLMKAAAHEMDDAKRLDELVQAEHIAVVDDCVVAPVVQSVVHNFIPKFVKNVSVLGFNSEGNLYTYTDGRK